MRATSFLLAAAQLAAARAFVAPRAWARRPAPTAVSENAQQGWTEYYDEAQQRCTGVRLRNGKVLRPDFLYEFRFRCN